MLTSSSADRRWPLSEFNTSSPPARCTLRVKLRHEALACSPRSSESSKECPLRTFCKLCRDWWGKVIVKAAAATTKRLETERTSTVPSARVWQFQWSGLSQQKQDTLEGSSKKVMVDALDHGRQTGEEYLVSHVYCQKFEQTMTWGSGIHHPKCSQLIKVERNDLRTVSFLQNYLEETNFHPEARQSQSTVMAQEKIAANWAFRREDHLRNLDLKTIHTI